MIHDTGRMLPALTADQMREVDRVMVDELHIGLIQMMENAGRNLADLAQHRYLPAEVAVLAGPGGNGGGGLVAARHLANRGVQVRVVLASGDPQVPAAKQQLDILRRIDVPITAEPPGHSDVVVDALLGYSLHGNPYGRAASLIDWANTTSTPVLSLDTPSGLDVTTGAAATPCIRADATLTLALPKRGLVGSPQVGQLYLADISVPARVYARFGYTVGHPFATGSVIELDENGQPR
ncbi:MAG TPA: NAD(P)H-hydrate epimerase [Jiangellaceae bacterium]